MSNSCSIFALVMSTASSGWLQNVTTASYGEEEAEEVLPLIEYRIAMFLLTYIMPIFLFSGTIGNAISFIVLLRKRMRTVSVYFYMLVLAVADTCVLYLSSFKTWLRLLTGFEMLHVSDSGCKIIMFLFLVSIHMSGWLIVLMSFDRFIAVWAPFSAARLCTLRRARIATSILTVVTIFYCLHIFWSLHLYVEQDGDITHKQCQPSEDDYFMTQIFPYLKLASYSLVPFIIVFTLNIAIIVKIMQTSSILAARRVNGAKSSGFSSRNKLTYMLLTVSIMWLILTAPFNVWSLVPNTASDRQSFARSFLLKIVCFMLMYLNHSINFWLYYITGKKFRYELETVFCYICHHKLFTGQRSTATLRTRLDKTNRPAVDYAMVVMTSDKGAKLQSSADNGYPSSQVAL